ncbi:MAG: NAD(+)/NADH kinase [Verrucomicrobiae bacterium]|nr:NAD(+)/NADH kinase [Verrucomicrobiae bacterium]
MAKTPRVGLIANLDKPGARSLLETLISAFEAREIPVGVETASAELLKEAHHGLSIAELDELAANSDVLIVLGGDGTLLGVVGQLGEAVKPIAAINVGTLGFLTCATAEEYQTLVDAIADGSYEVSPRTIIEATLRHGNDQPDQVVHALNEVTVVRCATPRLPHFKTRADAPLVNHYTGDGIIVATPTGSTAYSLSAGGPILEPGCGVFVMTPICPHALANRAIVFDDSREIELLVPDQRDHLLLTADGRLVGELTEPSRLKIRRASAELPLVTLPDGSFYRVLRRKLGWFGSSILNSDELPPEDPGL